NIAAAIGARAGTSAVVVEAAHVESIEIAPLDAEVPAGRTQQFNAIAVYSDGSRRDATLTVQWASSNPAVATIDSAGADRGLATGVAAGMTTITAAMGEVVSEAATLVVVAPDLAAVRIEPAEARIIIGETFSLTALAEYSDGSLQDVTEQVTWTSLDEGVARVSNQPGTRGEVSAIQLGVTDVRATLEGVLSAPTRVTVLPVPNRAPTVQIGCPDGGREGEPLDFSAAGSVDPDGQIVRFLWNFGDAPPLDVGRQVDISHTFAVSGLITVELTAEDDNGAQATARCEVLVQSANAPVVRFIRPQGVRQTTQGETIDVLVDARPGPGRAITGVSLLLDAEEVATAANPPYEMAFDVPLAAATGASLRLLARAVDDRGDAAVSEVVLLNVVNALPVPNFVAVPVDLRRVTVDASGVNDDTTAAADLEVRWDWEDDGTYDTAFSVDKQASHDYPAEGEYTIRMQVRDNVGQLASATRTVRFTDRQVVAGDIESQVWAGTIIITGDVRLLPGNTLTIVAGTQVQFTHVDQNNDNIGDYDLTISGTLRVEGEADAPVLFTVFGEDDRAPNAWNRIILNGDRPSTISHAIVEYAQTGIEIRDGSQLDNVVVQNSGNTNIYVNGGNGATLTDVTSLNAGTSGLQVRANAANFTATRFTVSEATRQGIDSNGNNQLRFNDLTVRDSGLEGIRMVNGTLRIDQGLIERSGGPGIYADDIAATLSDLLVRDNAGDGLLLRGATSGTLTHSNIVGNTGPGVTAIQLLGRDPTISINRNNIHSNATAGSVRYYSVSTNISATDNRTDGISVTSNAYNVPAGSTLLSLQVSFSRTAPQATGEVIDAQRNARIAGAFANNTTTEVAVPDARQIATRTNVTTCCGEAVTTVRRVDLREANAEAQLVVSRLSGTVNARENYLGVYPDILRAVAFSSPTAVDIQGFVGVPFDDQWDTGPYYGGPLAGDVIWQGIVHVSGDVTVPAGATLTVAPGTQVLVAPVDQENNRIGDYGIYATGAMVVDGTEDEPVVFQSNSPDGAPSDWERLRVSGANSAVRHAQIFDAHVGLDTQGAALSVTDTLLRGNNVGMEVRGGQPVLERLMVRDSNATGISFVTDGTLRQTRVVDSGTDGVLISANNTTLEDVLVTGSGREGIIVRGTGVTLSYVESTDNAEVGIHIEGTAGTPGGTVDHCSVTFNGGAGILVRSTGDTHPQATISNCNVFGNANREGGIGAPVYSSVALNLSATDNRTDGISVSSNVYRAANPSYEAQVTFSRTAPQANGVLRNSDNNANIASLSGNGTSWANTGGARNMLTIANVTTCCGEATMTLRNLRMVVVGQPQIELTVGVFSANRVNARGNFWGVFPNVQDRIREAQVGSTDFSGFVPAAIQGVGPRALP
ncbi:MAG: right-handed parallel beta-helix repeat-containing protein, partial [Myxococcales bacterium]|nr:right-handed parallel beta-helix repeat-containing protein [Myxococcales bacterium]